MDGGETLYPSEWRNAGLEGGSGSFFAAPHSLIYVGGVFLISTIFVVS